MTECHITVRGALHDGVVTGNGALVRARTNGGDAVFSMPEPATGNGTGFTNASFAQGFAGCNLSRVPVA